MKGKNTPKSTPGAKPPYLIPISAKGLFLQDDIYERLKFAYAVSPRNTIRAFKKVGIIITGPEDLEVLAQLHIDGQDVAGFRGQNGEIYAFNVREILNRPLTDPNSIRVTRGMVAGAPIEWTDMIQHGGQVKILR